MRLEIDTAQNFFEIGRAQDSNAATQAKLDEEPFDPSIEIVLDLHASDARTGLTVFLADDPTATRRIPSACIRRQPGELRSFTRIFFGIEGFKGKPTLGRSPQGVDGRTAEIFFDECLPRGEIRRCESLIDTKF